MAQMLRQLCFDGQLNSLLRNSTPMARGDLKQRITDLSDNLVTPAMKEWAQHIRLDANDAAHEEGEFSIEDAKTLHIFSEMFLTYAFTLPAMLMRATPKS
jgi:hypothetical protein